MPSAIAAAVRRVLQNAQLPSGGATAWRIGTPGCRGDAALLRELEDIADTEHEERRLSIPGAIS